MFHASGVVCRGFQHATRLLVPGVTGASEELLATLDIARGPLELHHPEQAARHRIVGHAGALEPHRRRAGRPGHALAFERCDPELATGGRIPGIAAQLRASGRDPYRLPFQLLGLAALPASSA